MPDDTGEAPPELIQRLSDYTIKAAREAKIHTSWLTTNQPYEEALVRFVTRTLSGPAGNACSPGSCRSSAGWRGRHDQLARAGDVEDWLSRASWILSGHRAVDLSLVDPDNRRPVDFALRARLLDEVDGVLAQDPATRAGTLADWLRRWTDGRIKLLVTAAGLRLRRELPDVFLAGADMPLATEITVPAGAVAFARMAGAERTCRPCSSRPRGSAPGSWTANIRFRSAASAGKT